MLRERGVGWCTAESDDKAAPTDSWEPFGYLRLRREEYSEEELAAWVERIRAGMSAGHDVFCYFKHEDKTSGPGGAERMADLLGTPGASEAAATK
jgi:uncharacterized protein YecE (DUF72 family)